MLLEEQPSTFRLIRKLNGHRVVAALTTLSSTGCEFDVVAPDVIANAERKLLQEQIPDATFEVVASGVTTISSCRVPWYDITVRRPLRDADWNRFYWLQSGQFVWKIHLASHSEPAHAKATLELFEPVLNSIKVKPQDSSVSAESPSDLSHPPKELTEQLADLEQLLPAGRFDRMSAHAFYREGLTYAREADQPGTTTDDAMRLRAAATKEFRKACKTDQSFCDGFIAMGCITLREGQVDDASSYFRQAIQLNPRSAAAFYYHANLLWETRGLRDRDAILNDLASSLKCDSEFTPAYRLRIIVSEVAGDLKQANADRVAARLHGKVEDVKIYPWTVRQARIRTAKGLLLEYSTVWTPLDSVAEGSEIRLYRESKVGGVALSIIFLGDGFVDESISFNELYELLKEELIGLQSKTSMLDSGTGPQTKVSLLDSGYENKMPWIYVAVGIQRMRISVFSNDGRLWLIRYSSSGSVDAFREHLQDGLKIIRSVRVEGTK